MRSAPSRAAIRSTSAGGLTSSGFWSRSAALGVDHAYPPHVLRVVPVDDELSEHRMADARGVAVGDVARCGERVDQISRGDKIAEAERGSVLLNVPT